MGCGTSTPAKAGATSNKTPPPAAKIPDSPVKPPKPAEPEPPAPPKAEPPKVEVPAPAPAPAPEPAKAPEPEPVKAPEPVQEPKPPKAADTPPPKPATLPADANIVFVLGGPGSGKGTQCERIVAKYGYQHLSAGDLLRDEVKAGTETGKMCATLMKEGKLVPQDVTIGLLKDAMIKSGATNFLIDGFPRALDQAKLFEKQVMPAQKVLFFDCPLETMQQRLLKRGETSGRADDNIDTIKKRFNTFTSQSLPVVTHYQTQEKAYKVSAVPAPDDVFIEVEKVMEGTAKPTPLAPPEPPELAAEESEAELAAGEVADAALEDIVASAAVEAAAEDAASRSATPVPGDAGGGAPAAEAINVEAVEPPPP